MSIYALNCNMRNIPVVDNNNGKSIGTFSVAIFNKSDLKMEYLIVDNQRNNYDEEYEQSIVKRESIISLNDYSIVVMKVEDSVYQALSEETYTEIIGKLVYTEDEIFLGTIVSVEVDIDSGNTISIGIIDKTDGITSSLLIDKIISVNNDRLIISNNNIFDTNNDFDTFEKNKILMELRTVQDTLTIIENSILDRCNDNNKLIDLILNKISNIECRLERDVNKYESDEFIDNYEESIIRNNVSLNYPVENDENADTDENLRIKLTETLDIDDDVFDNKTNLNSKIVKEISDLDYKEETEEKDTPKKKIKTYWKQSFVQTIAMCLFWSSYYVVDLI